MAARHGAPVITIEPMTEGDAEAVMCGGRVLRPQSGEQTAGHSQPHLHELVFQRQLG